MAFVFRASRFPSNKHNADLGPGSYNIGHAFLKRPAKSLVPFNSTTSRLISDFNVSDTPGPGAYIPVSIDPPNLAQIQKCASSVFASRTSRFDYFYKPSNGTSLSVLAHPDWTQLAQQQKRTRKVHSVVWTRIGTAPSIPARNQSHGYSQDANGDLHPRAAPNQVRSGVGNDTAGPGDYDVDDRALRIVRTCDFGRSSSKRSASEASASTSACPHLGPQTWVSGKAKPSAPFASQSKRFDDGHHDDIPAPGQYDPYPERIIKEDSTSVPKTRQLFSKQVGRSSLTELETDIPAVGTYNIKANSPFKTAAELQKRRKALSLRDPVPFQTQAPRFCLSASNETPGPGYYDVHERTVIDPELVAYKKSKRSAFGIGAERFRDIKKSEVPGPGDYRIERAQPRYKSGRTSSFFQSHSKRFMDPKTDGPPPTAYQKLPDWRRSQTNQSKTAAFLTSQKSRPTETKAADTPGPGAYVIPCRSSSRASTAAAAFRFTEERFQNKAKGGDDDCPGVGTYDLSSHDSLIKRSFNITISDDYHIEP